MKVESENTPRAVKGSSNKTSVHKGDHDFFKDHRTYGGKEVSDTQNNRDNEAQQMVQNVERQAD